MSEFIHMGGYAPYVWGSYAVVAVTMVANLWQALRRHRQTRAAVNSGQPAQSPEGRR